MATAARVEARTRQEWPALIEQFDDGAGPWRTFTEQVITLAQRELLRVTSAYVATFATLELGRRERPPRIDSERYVGLARDGRPLAEALISPLIGTKAALKEGRRPSEALKIGLDRALRAADLDTLHVPRRALVETVTADPRFTGWRRVVSGTCGACAAKAGGTEHGLMFQVHPGCKCVGEPEVSGVPNRFPRPTGAEILAAKSAAEQDEALGPEAAKAFRNGLPLESLVGRSPMENEPDWITQKPLDAALT